MLVLLGNNLSPSFRDHFNARAQDPSSGIEIIPASIGAFNGDRPDATREPFAELWFGSPQAEYNDHLDKLNGQPVTVIQSTSGRAAEHFTALLLAIRNLKRHGAGTVTVAMPYVWGARQDNFFVEEGRMASVAAEDVPFLLKAAGAERVILQEMHSRTSEDFFIREFGRDNVVLLSSAALFAEELPVHPAFPPASRIDGAPDGADKPLDAGQRRAVEFTKAARGVTDMTQAQQQQWMFRLAKKRTMVTAGKSTSEVVPFGDNSHVAGKDCVMIDDMGDSCGTLLNSGGALVEQGAAGLFVCLTHWAGDAGSLEKLMRAKRADGKFLVNRLTVTDTCPGIEDDIRVLERQYPGIGARVTVLPTAPLFARAIENLTP